MFYLGGILISLVLLIIFLVILRLLLDKLFETMQVDGSWTKIVVWIVGFIGLASILLGFGGHYYGAGPFWRG